MKNGFLLYSDQEEIFKKLSDKDAGRLIKVIFEYERTGKLPKLDNILDLSITSIKSALDRNRSKYDHICKIRSEAAQKRKKNNS